MSKTKIEWCARPGTMPETWNPTTGCNKVSQGCKNCYAEKQHARMMHMHPQKYRKPFLDGVLMHEEVLSLPEKWKTPRTVFVNSMSDLFHEDVDVKFIYNVFSIMEKNPLHTFLILTKRPERMQQVVRDWNQFDTPLHNIWLGTSVEDQATADERIPHLLRTPAAVKFLSCEPLLEHVDLTRFYFQNKDGSYPFSAVPYKSRTRWVDLIDWVITGGESGHKARPMHPEWARSLRDQCQEAKVPFFFKQWGEWLPFEETAQPPFWRSCSNGEQFDSHRMNMIDPETGDAGKWHGSKWYDTMDAIQMSIENGSDIQINFLKMGKHASGRLLDGREWNDFPEVVLKE